MQDWCEELKRKAKEREEELERISNQNKSLISDPKIFRENVQHYIIGKLAQIIHNNVKYIGDENSRQDTDWFTAEDYINFLGGIEKNVEHYERLLLGGLGAEGVKELDKSKDRYSFFKLADISIGRFTFEDLWGSLRNHGDFLRKRGVYGEITSY